MNKVLYLHIGPGKSGTSAIQSFLAKNNIKLKDLGIGYPDIDDISESGKGVVTGGNSATLARSFLDDAHPFSLRNKKDKVAVLKKFEEVLSASETSLILSSELLSMLNSFGINRLKEVIEKYDYQVQCIFYLRRHDQIVESDYAQQVKKHSYTKVLGEDFYKRIISSYNFESIIGSFEEHFGYESIIVRVYEKEQFINGSLLEDFLYALGLLEYKEQLIFEKKAINPSPSHALLEIMRITNSFELEQNISEKLLNLTFNDKCLQKKTNDNYISYQSKINIIDSCVPMYQRIAKKYFKRNYLFKEILEPYDLQALENRDIVSTFIRLMK